MNCAAGSFAFPVLFHSCSDLGSCVLLSVGLHSSQGAVLDSRISLEGSPWNVAGLCEGTEGAALQLAHTEPLEKGLSGLE